MRSNSALLFEIHRGAEPITRHRFTEPSITIGSGPSALLRIAGGTVSDLHCVVHVEPDGSLMLLDLGSDNGTVVGGQRVPRAALQSGDAFFVGIHRVRVVREPASHPRDKRFTAPAFEGEGARTFEEDVITEDGMSFVMRAGTATHTIGINDKRAKVLEVHQIWGDTLLDSRHYRTSDEGDVTIGSSLGHRWHFLGVDMGWVPAPLHRILPFTPPMWSEVHSVWKNDFYADDERLPGGKGFKLFRSEDGTHVAHIAKGWDGFVDIGAQRFTFQQLAADGRATDTGSEFRIPVDDDIRLAVDVDGTTYFAHKVAEGARLIDRNTGNPDYPFIGIGSFFVFLGLMFGLVMFFTPARPNNSVSEVPDYVVAMAIAVPPEQEAERDMPKATPDAGEGAKTKGSEGKVGKKDAKTRLASGDKVDIQQTQKDRQIVANAGLLGALSDVGGADGAFASAALDRDLTGGVGALIGAKGSQLGTNGLGERGDGLSGGGTVDRLGGLGTTGIGPGRSGYYDQAGNLGPKGTGGIGSVGGEPIIIGALDRSLIDAVVKRSMNQIRYCYQRELAKSPALGGKVIVKFVIAKDGSVSAASKKSSTLGSPAVESCIVSRFTRMKFPTPKGGGIVIVSYPFIFSPA